MAMQPEERISRRRFLAASAGLAAAAFPAGIVRAKASGQTNFELIPEKETQRLRVLESGHPVLVYNWGDQLKAGVPAHYRRAAYVHPLYGLDGEVLTDDFPRDHYHHRGMMWVWPDVKVGDGPWLDMWHLPQTGRVRKHFNRWLERACHADGARIGVINDWKTQEGLRIMQEEVHLFVHPANPVGRAIDFRLRLRALDQPIHLRGEQNARKGYGGFSIRFAPRKGTVITTPAGEVPDSDRRRFPWADESGRFGGRTKESGIAIFSDRQNPAFPEGWTLRHYGFLGPCWPGLEATTVEPARPVTLRYRVWVHRGEAKAGEVARQYAKWADQQG